MQWWGYVRLATAALGLAAIIRQIFLAIGRANAATTEYASDLSTVLTNFFSYFTILSNLIAVVALSLGGIWVLRNRQRTAREPAWLAVLMTAAGTYMLVTGVVYNVLLRNEVTQSIPVTTLADWWSNEVLHLVVPLIIVLDVFVAPHRRALPWRAAWIVVIFPILWAIYTLTRANFVTSPRTGEPWWYPYPFLDPHLVPGGYLGVSGYILGIAAVIIGLALLIIWFGRKRGTLATEDLSEVTTNRP